MSPEKKSRRIIDFKKRSSYSENNLTIEPKNIKDIPEELVLSMLYGLGFSPKGSNPIIKDGRGRESIALEFEGIHAYVKNQDLADTLRKTIYEGPKPGIESQNLLTFVRAFTHTNSPFNKCSFDEIILLLNRGDDNLETFFDICVKRKIPVIDSPNNVPNLVKYDPEDRKDKTVIMIGPFRGPFNNDLKID